MQMAGAHTAVPSEQMLRWAAGVVGRTRVRSAENLSRSDHRPSGTFRLRIDGPAAGATDVILKVPAPRWILDGMVITNARALRLAETHGLAAPRLIAADLDALVEALAREVALAGREAGHLVLQDRFFGRFVELLQPAEQHCVGETVE